MIQQRLEMVQTGSKWLQTAKITSERFEMVQSDLK